MAKARTTPNGRDALLKIESHYLELVRRRRLYSTLSVLIFVLLLIAGFDIADSRSAGGFWDGISHVGDYPADVLAGAWQYRSDLPGHLLRFLPDLIETLDIAAVSLLFGGTAGLVLSLLSTRGLAKWPWAVPIFRRLMDITRALPEIVVALVLIFVLGGGPIPAVIAISLHTAGALGKMFSEVAENADLKPVDGLSSVGANWTQRMLLGVLPQVAPIYVSYALLRFEINIRASAILGFVGAGGLGYELRNAISWGQGQFDEAVAIFVLLFGAIVFFDQLSSRLRSRLIKGQTL